jgi:hypothetical protein
METLMAKKDKVKELRQKSRFAAMEGLRPQGGPPVPPRKAMKQAKKASKKLAYPVSPYPGAGPVQVYRWAQNEWWQLGKWKNFAMPFAILSALLTWEKESALRDRRWEEVDKAEVKEMARQMYLAPPHRKRRKLLGFIPLLGRK